MAPKTFLASIAGAVLLASAAIAAPSYYNHGESNNYQNDYYEDGKYDNEYHKDDYNKVSYHKDNYDRYCHGYVHKPTYDKEGRGWGYENGQWCLISEGAQYGSHYNNGHESYHNGYGESKHKSFVSNGYGDSPRKGYYAARPYAGATYQEPPHHEEEYNEYSEYYDESKYDVYKAVMCGEKEVPFVVKGEAGFGHGLVLLDRHTKEIKVAATHFNIAPLTKIHIHGPAPPNNNASVLFDLFPQPNFSTQENPVRNPQKIVLNDDQHKWLAQGLLYVNLHNAAHAQGAVRGNLLCASKSCEAPRGADVARFFDDGICNRAIFASGYGY
ncbi:hypothetical protein SpCBS45565_g04424 [Spizellomyces sp. 'palustris']|nr:hypothetical protein SpCBS45565_g04424 [Spizellomyces sp. 'palustris']